MSLVTEKGRRYQSPVRTPEARDSRPNAIQPIWGYALAVVVGLLLLDVVGGASYALITTLFALALFGTIALTSREERKGLLHNRADRLDLVMIGLAFVVVVALYRVALVIIEGNDLLLFVSFASGLFIDVGAPVVYTVLGQATLLSHLGVVDGRPTKSGHTRSICSRPSSSRSRSGVTATSPRQKTW